MRRVLLSLTVFLTVSLFLQPGSATGATIGGITLPEVSVPADWTQAQPVRSKPVWLPTNLGDDATVILVPGTDDFDGADQWGRTVAIGFYDLGTDASGNIDPTRVVIVGYPAAFGFSLFGQPIYLVGDATYNDSVDAGTSATVAAAEQAWANAADPSQVIIINGYSQSGPVAWNAAYLLHQSGNIPDENIVVLLGADTRFPNTGVETVIPSFIPGLYMNGPRDESDTGDIQVISYCVRGDSACGLGNPLVHPFTTLFYLLPGAYIHGANGDYVNQYTVIKEWQSDDGNTTYVVLDGGNPWGMMLRGLGIPVAPEFDTVLSTVVPVPMPGEASTIAGYPVPTPREIQQDLYDALGWTVPVTDPDALDKQAAASGYSTMLRTSSAESTGPPDVESMSGAVAAEEPEGPPAALTAPEAPAIPETPAAPEAPATPMTPQAPSQSTTAADGGADGANAGDDPGDGPGEDSGSHDSPSPNDSSADLGEGGASSDATASEPAADEVSNSSSATSSNDGVSAADE